MGLSMPKKTTTKTKTPNAFAILKPYKKYTLILLVLTVAANSLNLAIPKIIARGLDNYSLTQHLPYQLLPEFIIIVVAIFLLTLAQNIAQVITSEYVARDLRTQLANKIATQKYATIEKWGASVLLTNLTADIDSIKTFISLGVTTIISSILIIVGTSILLILIDWQLATLVLLIIPIIGLTFAMIMGKVRALFLKGQQVIDWLNRVINESILGAGLIRILHSQSQEEYKFSKANEEATQIGLKILGYFASLIPIITLTANMAVLVILILGGHFVITERMSLGDFAAFNSYLTLLIFPIIMIGFMTNLIARANASYQRLQKVLKTKPVKQTGVLRADKLKGKIEVKNLSLTLRNKPIVKETSFIIKPGSRTAIVGPTASGKTQLINLLVGLIEPTSGKILYDGKDLKKYDRNSLLSELGVVFQESVLFNISLRNNLAFSQEINEPALRKALETAELSDYVNSLPHKLDTLVSERGTSLSGGQKQRLMLARALARDPKILFLDDFTARVDIKTEQKILTNVRQNYPDVTLISITQKIASITDYEQILVLMEGELIAAGTHQDLLQHSPEYIQMYESQKSTNQYELST